MRVLHVGCGGSKIDKIGEHSFEEIRFDIDERCKPDILGSVTAIPLPDCSVDFVFSNHLIEHLYIEEVEQAMREFWRVLVPGGSCQMNCPDLESVARAIIERGAEEPAYISPSGPVTPVMMLYGFSPELRKGNRFMAHHYGFTAQSIAHHLGTAGFVDIGVEREVEFFNLKAVGVRPKESMSAHGV